MATLPSVFYGDYSAGSDLSFLLANVPPGSGPDYLFDKVVTTSDAFVKGSGKDEIFHITDGTFVKGGKGYDAVVQSPEGGVLGSLDLHSSVESGVLTGSLDGNISGNKKDNNVVGNDGDNILTGRKGKDVLIGNDGDDTLHGNMGKDTLSGGMGDDTLYGGKGKDKLFGGDDDDVLFGNQGKDKLFGGDGDDELFGQSGKDTLLGGGGDDTLFGGNGRDQLTGGDGEDVFGFLKGQTGVDVIKDFEAGVDKIDLTDFGTSLGKLKFDNDGDDVVVTVDKGGANQVKFKLIGYQSSDIDGSFFQF
ncbi:MULTISPECIES: calcium-binding protein [Alphaproteobacteria]|uniref:calcium-binding protein n=1 Tax=Alphaproteobacteria TaxID=28211 RepID=UPI0032637E17